MKNHAMYTNIRYLEWILFTFIGSRGFWVIMNEWWILLGTPEYLVVKLLKSLDNHDSITRRRELFIIPCQFSDASVQLLLQFLFSIIYPTMSVQPLALERFCLDLSKGTLLWLLVSLLLLSLSKTMWYFKNSAILKPEANINKFISPSISIPE